MKILHCLNYFLPGQVAGTEIYVMALIKELQKRGVQSSVLIPNMGKNVNESYAIEGFQVLMYAEPSIVNRSLQMGKRKPDGLNNFSQLVLQEKPDVIHFHELSGSNGLALEHVKLAKTMGFKTIMTFHLSANTCKTGTLMFKGATLCDGIIREKQCSECWFQHKGIEGWKTSVLNSSSSLLRRLNTDISCIPSSVATALSMPFLINELRQKFISLIYHCDKLVVLTKWYKRMLILNGSPAEKVSYIAQGLPFDTEFTQVTRQKYPFFPIRFVFVGRINSFKGLHLLIEALINLPSGKICLDIYGQTNDSAYERNLRIRTRTISNIRWKGKLQQKEVVNTMRQYDVLCLCSTFSEMSPFVIQEAFAARIPVLASNVYGNAEQIIEGKNGWLFAFNNVADLNQKIMTLIENPSLIERAKENIPDSKAFSVVANEYELLYNEVRFPTEKINNKQD